jgi:pyridoxine 4-dehydrogenase
LDQGANLWNGGLHYGTPDSNSTHLLRYYFEKYPEDAKKVVINIKGAFTHDVGPTGSRDAIRASVEAALRGLGGAKSIDIFEMGKLVLELDTSRVTDNTSSTRRSQHSY